MTKTTKKAFATSLKKFMQNKTIAKITVKDIVTDCEVGRKTFYYHFQDIYELLAWIYKTEALEALADCNTFETWPTGVREIGYFVYNNQTFCKNAYYSIGRERAVNFFYPIVCSLFMEILDNLSIQVEIDQEDKLFIVDFYAYAFIGIMIKWSLSDIDDPESFINRLILLVETDLKKTIKRLSR